MGGSQTKEGGVYPTNEKRNSALNNGAQNSRNSALNNGAQNSRNSTLNNRKNTNTNSGNSGLPIDNIHGGNRNKKRRLRGGVAPVQFSEGTQPSESVMMHATTASMKGGRRHTKGHKRNHKRSHRRSRHH